MRPKTVSPPAKLDALKIVPLKRLSDMPPPQYSPPAPKPIIPPRARRGLHFPVEGYLAKRACRDIVGHRLRRRIDGGTIFAAIVTSSLQFPNEDIREIDLVPIFHQRHFTEFGRRDRNLVENHFAVDPDRQLARFQRHHRAVPPHREGGAH